MQNIRTMYHWLNAKADEMRADAKGQLSDEQKEAARKRDEFELRRIQSNCHQTQLNCKRTVLVVSLLVRFLFRQESYFAEKSERATSGTIQTPHRANKKAHRRDGGASGRMQARACCGEIREKAATGCVHFMRRLVLGDINVQSTTYWRS